MTRICLAAFDAWWELQTHTRVRAPLVVALQAYASRAGVDPNSIKLMFEGSALKKEDTPDSMGMEDGDVVEVVVQQVRRRTAVGVSYKWSSQCKRQFSSPTRDFPSLSVLLLQTGGGVA